MKLWPFFLFAGAAYDPDGGMGDYIGRYYTAAEARAGLLADYARVLQGNHPECHFLEDATPQWAHIARLTPAGLEAIQRWEPNYGWERWDGDDLHEGDCGY